MAQCPGQDSLCQHIPYQTVQADRLRGVKVLAQRWKTEASWARAGFGEPTPKF